MTQLVFESCDPRERADQIKALFARNGRPEFEAVFERAYRRRAAGGLKSWIALDGDKVLLHVSVSPQRFHDGTRTLMGGVMGDLMADESQRDFWAPLRLLRTVVADLKREGRMDFLLTTTTPLASSLFKAGGFKPLGQLRRYVFPLFAPYVVFARWRSGTRVSPASAAPLEDPGFVALLPSLGSAGFWRAEACAEFYATRIPRETYADGTWLKVGGDDRPCLAWGLLCRHGTWSEVGLADAYWNDDKDLAGIVSAAARWGRQNRISRLSMSTLDGSRVAQQVSRLGFLARPYSYGVMLQQLGAATPPPAEDWFLTGFVGSGW